MTAAISDITAFASTVVPPERIARLPKAHDASTRATAMERLSHCDCALYGFRQVVDRSTKPA